MFAAEAAFVGADQPGCTLRDLTELTLTLVGLEVEDRAQMQFARTDVAVIDAIQAHLVQDGLEFRQISGQALRCDGRVFDDADRPRVAFHAAQHAQTGLAQFPDLAHLGPIDPGAGVSETRFFQIRLQFVGARIKFVSVQLGHQQSCRRPFDKEHQAAHARVGPRQVQDLAVDQFDRRRAVPQGHQIGLIALFQRVAVRADDHLSRRRQRVQRQFDFCHEHQSSL